MDADRKRLRRRQPVTRWFRSEMHRRPLLSICGFLLPIELQLPNLGSIHVALACPRADRRLHALEFPRRPVSSSCFMINVCCIRAAKKAGEFQWMYPPFSRKRRDRVYLSTKLCPDHFDVPVMAGGNFSDQWAKVLSKARVFNQEYRLLSVWISPFSFCQPSRFCCMQVSKCRKIGTRSYLLV